MFTAKQLPVTGASLRKTTSSGATQPRPAAIAILFESFDKLVRLHTSRNDFDRLADMIRTVGDGGLLKPLWPALRLTI